MYVRRFEQLADIQSHRESWDSLADGCVFRTPAWLGAWWSHYGEHVPSRELCILAAFEVNGSTPTAILPSYVETTWTRGRVLRLLGDGEVCSDHLGVLTTPTHIEEALSAFADWLTGSDEWDAIDFEAIDADDSATLALHEELLSRGCAGNRLPAGQCWAIPLPASWDEFLALQSKSHRKQLRQLARRVLESREAQWRLATTTDELDAAWPTLIDLHQRRRRSLGEAGCFASPTWAAFHHDVARRLLAEGKLRASTLHIAGVPVAAEYHLASRRATYAYQGGVDPDRLAEEPGRLSTICSIKHAIDEGHATFDFLRGDEPYKAHWRAEPKQTYRLLAAAPGNWPQLRHEAWNTVRELGRLAKPLTNLMK